MDFSDIKPFKYKRSKSVFKNIKLIPSDEKLTAAAGLGTVVEIFDQSGLRDEFIKCLPKRVSHRSQGSYKLALNMICGFLHGFDCLDDYDHLSEEEALKAAFGESSPRSRTLGDFIKDFEDEHISRLNKFLSRMSWSMMASLEENLPEDYRPGEVTLDIDSTDHPQSGDQMEGLDWNYKGHWCLDSQEVFNQAGFCHGFDLRSGNTKSGVGADWLLRGAIADGKTQVRRRFEGKTRMRADSAYCKQDVFKELLSLGVKFTITANDGTTGWKKCLENEGLVWQPWEYSEKEKLKAEAKGVDLPEVELSKFNWSPKWSQKEGSKLIFPIIVKRTKAKPKEARKRSGQLDLIGDDGYMIEVPYDYYAVVTNFPLDLAVERSEDSDARPVKRYSLQEVMEFHHKRAHSENFIREEKYGYGLKHFPCKKLNANRAYGLLAQVAHNLLRWVAIMMKPEKPHFSKKLRKRFIFHPGKVVYHARQVFLKIKRSGYEEVSLLREAWGLPVIVSPQYSTA